jgi:hypothetical protein
MLTIDTNIDTDTAADVACDALARVQPGAADYLLALKEDYEQWINVSLTRTNEALYDMLAQCLRVYEIMTEDSDNGARLRDELKAHIRANSMKFNTATHTAVKIARIVFATDSKRASAYGTVLCVAIANGITHAGLADFIREKGGLENIRLQRVRAQRETAEARAERVYAGVKARSLAVATGAGLKANSDLAKAGSRVILLATLAASGDCTVHAVVQSEAAVNAAFAAHDTQNKKTAGTTAAGSNSADVKAAEQRDERAALRMRLAREMLNA